MQKDDKVIILKGYGYTDITRGIDRFCRALKDESGTVTFLAPKQQVHITLSDGRKVITDRNCLVSDYR